MNGFNLYLSDAAASGTGFFAISASRIDPFICVVHLTGAGTVEGVLVRSFHIFYLSQYKKRVSKVVISLI